MNVVESLEIAVALFSQSYFRAGLVYGEIPLDELFGRALPNLRRNFLHSKDSFDLFVFHIGHCFSFEPSRNVIAQTDYDRRVC